jgi:hypothetical protein
MSLTATAMDHDHSGSSATSLTPPGQLDTADRTSRGESTRQMRVAVGGARRPVRPNVVDHGRADMSRSVTCRLCHGSCWSMLTCWGVRAAVTDFLLTNSAGARLVLNVGVCGPVIVDSSAMMPGLGPAGALTPERCRGVGLSLILTG